MGSSSTCRGAGQPGWGWLQGGSTSLFPGCSLARPAPVSSQAGEPSVSRALQTQHCSHQPTQPLGPPTPALARQGSRCPSPPQDLPVAALCLQLGLQQHLLHVGVAGGEPGGHKLGLRAPWATAQLHPGAWGTVSPAPAWPLRHPPALPKPTGTARSIPDASLVHPIVARSPPLCTQRHCVGPGHPICPRLLFGAPCVPGPHSACQSTHSTLLLTYPLQHTSAHRGPHGIGPLGAHQCNRDPQCTSPHLGPPGPHRPRLPKCTSVHLGASGSHRPRHPRSHQPTRDPIAPDTPGHASPPGTPLTQLPPRPGRPPAPHGPSSPVRAMAPRSAPAARPVT